jgi:hypothetical protein
MVTLTINLPDEEHAQRIRFRLNELLDAMNNAADAGLQVRVKVDAALWCNAPVMTEVSKWQGTAYVFRKTNL